MSQNKTQATTSPAAAHVAAIADEARRADCTRLMQLMAKATGLPAVMWGSSIVGFGVHRYPLAGGKTGEICAVGFASRKSDIVIYGAQVEGAAPLLARLGPHKLGKGCLYIKRLSDVDLAVLETLVRQAAALGGGA